MPGRPTPRREAPSPGVLVPLPQHAKPAHRSARCWVGDGFGRPHLPHPQPVGSGPRPHARKEEWSGVGERPTPNAPHPGNRRPPQASLCSPHSAQSQLTRARAVVFVMGPHTRIPRTHSQWVVGPGRTSERTSGRGGGGRDPRCCTPRQEAPPPGTLMPPRQHAKPAWKSARCGVGDRSPRPHPPHPQPVGSGPRPHAPKNERLGVGERPSPDAPQQGKRPPPQDTHAAPTARKAGSQERALWGWWRVVGSG